MDEMGRIEVTETSDGFVYTWTGGDWVEITRELMVLAIEGVFVFKSFPPEPGDVFTFGPFELEANCWATESILLARRK